jgi:predicted amidophosphoribosyltransferase
MDGQPLPLVQPHLNDGEAPLFEARAAFSYDGTLRELVHAWKFDGRGALTRPLARRMAERLALAWQGRLFDLAVPLPPSRQSLKKRGFDAAGELAGAVAGLAGLPLKQALRLTRERQAQHTLDRAGRLANAEGAYRALDLVKGKQVLLLDDLLSTGATAQAAARALLDAGAAGVGVGVLAHAAAR